MTILRSKVALVVVGVVVVAVLAVAGARRVQAEPQARAADTGVWLVISHKVYDYDLWKREHDRTADVKRSGYGWKRSELYWVEGDRNHVMAMELFPSRERAEAFAGSQDLTYEMAASGVSSQPELRIVRAAPVPSRAR